MELGDQIQVPTGYVLGHLGTLFLNLSCHNINDNHIGSNHVDNPKFYLSYVEQKRIDNIGVPTMKKCHFSRDHIAVSLKKVKTGVNIKLGKFMRKIKDSS